MKEFNYKKYLNFKIDNEIIKLIGSIRECKGRQELYLQQRPEELKTLVEVAKRQSTESSNIIEGIRTTQSRLKQLIENKTTPKNRDEKEILGYRNVLNIIHESFDAIPIRPNFILQLHKELYKFLGTSIGGKFKNSPNEIQDSNGNVLFKPVEPWQVPEFMNNLCNEYNNAINKYNIEPLLIIPVFAHDFLCIHPFNDGNGRISRLLTTLLLYQNGYMVGKYISLEKKIEITKNEYYLALSSASNKWHQNKNDETEFIKYILGTILAAYRDFEERVNMVNTKLTALEMVENAINTFIGKFTKTQVLEKCPEIAKSSVEAGLLKLTKQGKIAKHGGGRSTYYIRLK